MSSMAFSSPYLEEPQVFDNYNPTLFDDYYDQITGFYDNCSSLFNSLYCPYPMLGSNYPSLYQENFVQNFMPSPYVKEGFYSAATPSKGEQLPYNWGYWNNDNDSYFSSCCWLDDKFYSYGEENDDMSCGHGLQREEDMFPGEEPRENYVNKHESGEKQFFLDEFPWYEDSWFGHSMDEGSSYYSGKRDSKYPYIHRLEDMGFCGGIFGYWPCLAKELQQ